MDADLRFAAVAEMKKKRIRTPVAKPGEVIVAWGRPDPHNSPALVYAYPDLAGRNAILVLMDAFERESYVPSFETYPNYKTEPSMVKQLEAMGYDITTLKFTIRKKNSDEEVELK